jgi:hypothetical protein
MLAAAVITHCAMVAATTDGTNDRGWRVLRVLLRQRDRRLRDDPVRRADVMGVSGSVSRVLPLGIQSLSYVEVG